MADYQQRSQEAVSGWQVSGVLFAATILIMVGIFHAIAGLVAIFDDDIYTTANYTFELDDTLWGFIHLGLGALLVFGGWSLLSGKLWAVVLAITLAVFSAVANFFYIPIYPFWSIVMIAAAVWVIWSLSKPLPDRP